MFSFPLCIVVDSSGRPFHDLSRNHAGHQRVQNYARNQLGCGTDYKQAALSCQNNGSNIIKYVLNTSCHVIKSPQSGVTLCFQFVSAASAATTFASHVKTVWAKPYMFGTKNIWVWGNVLDDLSMTLTQGHGCGMEYQKFVCLHDKVRTTHQITTKHYSFIAIVMVITWLDFGEVLFKTFILANFL